MIRMTDCRTTLDCSRVRVVLAIAIIRSCPRRCSIYSHINRILKKLKQKKTRRNSILSLIKLKRSSLLSLASIPAFGSDSIIKATTNSPASAVSEETYFSGGNVCSPIIGTDSGLEASNFQQSQGDISGQVAISYGDAASDLKQISTAYYPKQSIASEETQADANSDITNVCPNVIQKSSESINFLDLNFPESASLTFLAATDHLCSYLGERSSFLPESSMITPSRADLTDYVRIILEYVCSVPNHMDALPLSLAHGMELASRILVQNPDSVIVLRPLLLSTIQILAGNVYEGVGPRLLSYLLAIPDFAGSIIRAINIGLQQVSKNLQETYQTELMSFPAPCGLRDEVFANSSTNEEKKFHILLNMPPDKTSQSCPILAPQKKMELSKRSLYIADMFNVVLQTLHEDDMNLEKFRYDLECSLRILEQATLYISDRYPQFVERIFESIRLVHTLIG